MVVRGIQEHDRSKKINSLPSVIYYIKLKLLPKFLEKIKLEVKNANGCQRDSRAWKI